MQNSLFYFLIFSLLIVLIPNSTSAQSCLAGVDCSPRGVGIPGNDQCGNGAWEDALIGRESGGNYQATARGSACPSCTASGRYQFINSTRRTIGQNHGLPCGGGGFGSAEHQAFMSCEGLQDDYFRALVSENIGYVESACNQYCGTIQDGCPVTMSGLLAMAHNVGPTCANQWAAGGTANLTHSVGGTQACRDAFGTNAAAEYGCGMGGYDMSAYGSSGGGAVSSGCGFGYTAGPPNPVPFQGHLIGCDEDISEQTTDRVDALMEQQFEAANSVITQPTPVEQLTCFDQTTEIFSQIGGIHSDPQQGNIDDSIVPAVQQPLQQQMQQFMTGNIAGGITDVINNAFSSIASSFGGLSGLFGGGGGASTNCDMQEQAWLISQCIEMPQIPSLGDILGGEIGEIMGTVGGVVGALGNPERMMEQVCSMANSALQGLLGGGGGGAFEAAAENTFSPITDTVGGN